MIMGHKNTFYVFLVFVAFTASQARAEKHVVGGGQGWETSVDFDSWTSSTTFKVGDQLVFKYSSGLHSVVELADENAYKNCDIGTALDSKNTGNDMVKLNKPGTRYFACGTLGHCDQGMKVKIKVVTGKAPSSPASPSTSSSSSSSPTASTSEASMASHFFATNFVFVASFLATLLVTLP